MYNSIVNKDLNKFKELFNIYMNSKYSENKLREPLKEYKFLKGVLDNFHLEATPIYDNSDIIGVCLGSQEYSLSYYISNDYRIPYDYEYGILGVKYGTFQIISTPLYIKEIISIGRFGPFYRIETSIEDTMGITKFLSKRFRKEALEFIEKYLRLNLLNPVKIKSTLIS